MEVTNSCAQSSHDQAWRMRPLRLKADFSAISTTLPQRGHLGRRNSYVTGSRRRRRIAWSSSKPPRRSLIAPRSVPIRPNVARGLWRRCDANMKLSWPETVVGQQFLPIEQWSPGEILLKLHRMHRVQRLRTLRCVGLLYSRRSCRETVFTLRPARARADGTSA